MVTQNLTLDGSIEMLGDFTDFRGYWPAQDEDQTGITAVLNEVPRYVVSATPDEPGWANSTILTGDWLARVRELKEEDGQEIAVTGSITLCHALLKAGVVDEVRLFVYPVVQRSGRRLFPQDHEVARLRLLENRTFERGVTLVRYRP